jgi:hypothetical protein
VFDAPKEEDIYANPPSILSTLQNQLQSDINDPALRYLRQHWKMLLLIAGQRLRQLLSS